VQDAGGVSVGCHGHGELFSVLSSNRESNAFDLASTSVKERSWLKPCSLLLEGSPPV